MCLVYIISLGVNTINLMFPDTRWIYVFGFSTTILLILQMMVFYVRFRKSELIKMKLDEVNGTSEQEALLAEQ